MNDRWLPLNPIYKKIASVGFFSYLGFTFVLALYFGLMRAAETAAHLLQRTFKGPFGVTGAGGIAVDERGCFTGHGGSNKRLNSGGEEGSRTSSAGNYHPEQERGHLELAVAPSWAGELSGSIIGRRAALKIAAAGGLVAATAMLGEGIVEAYQKPVTQEWDFRHPMLSGLEGSLTIVHATDFHFGMFLDVEDLARLVETLNRIDGDALFLTGDIYHSPLTPIEKSVPILKRLKGRRMGNFAVLGNHEFYAGVSRSLSALEEAHIHVLRNQWHTYEDGCVRVHIGGIDDPIKNWLTGTSFPKFSYLMKIVPREPGMKLLLSHRPTILPEASKAEIDLVLSGHTHGGQIILPSISQRRGISVARLVSQFTHGWYHMGNTTMYLNRGVGLTFVPWRINCPPEIAVFRLGDGDTVS